MTIRYSADLLDPSGVDGLIRKLDAIDVKAVEDHLLRLSFGQRVLRFGQAMTDELIRHHCRSRQDQMPGMFGFERKGCLLAMVEIAPMPKPIPAAEIAISAENDALLCCARDRLLHTALKVLHERQIVEAHIEVHSEDVWAISTGWALGAKYDSTRDLLRIAIAPALARMAASTTARRAA